MKYSLRSLIIGMLVAPPLIAGGYFITHWLLVELPKLPPLEDLSSPPPSSPP